MTANALFITSLLYTIAIYISKQVSFNKVDEARHNCSKLCENWRYSLKNVVETNCSKFTRRDKYSFFAKIIKQWNDLPKEIAEAKNSGPFKMR